MQNIPEIDNKIIEEHGLSLEEYEKILEIITLWSNQKTRLRINTKRKRKT